MVSLISNLHFTYSEAMNLTLKQATEYLIRFGELNYIELDDNKGGDLSLDEINTKIQGVGDMNKLCRK